MKRFEFISHRGVSFFSDDPPNLFAKLGSISVLDHQEKKVICGVESDYKTAISVCSRLGEAVRARLALGTPIDWAEYQTMRLNSFERMHIVPLLTTDALLQSLTEHVLPNCEKISAPPTTYEDAVVATYLPELVSRCREMLKTARQA